MEKQEKLSENYHQIQWTLITTSAFVPKTLPFKWICCCTEYLMIRFICKKGFVLFLFPHRTYVLNICYNCLTEAILTNIQNICFFKVLNTLYNILAWFVTDCYLLSEGFVIVRIVIITNFVGIKKVVCNSYFNKSWMDIRINISHLTMKTYAVGTH